MTSLTIYMGARPFAAPVTTATYTVPGTIDHTGATNAAALLNTFVGTVPDGSIIDFAIPGGVYRMDSGLYFASRHNLIFEGNGTTTLESNGDAHEGSSLFNLNGDSDVAIRGFSLVGNSPTPGVHDPANQWAYGVLLWGGSNIEITNVTTSAVWGDCLYVDNWANGVWYHDNHGISSGRMGVAIASGQNILVERNAFDVIAYGAFDIEPNLDTDVASNVKFLNNTVGSIPEARGIGFLFGANGAAGSSISGVTVSGNTITGYGLDTYVNITTRRTDIVFTNNTSTQTVSGPVLYLAHIDGLTVTGNTQPLSSGSLVSVTDCTNAVTSPNP